MRSIHISHMVKLVQNSPRTMEGYDWGRLSLSIVPPSFMSDSQSIASRLSFPSPPSSSDSPTTNGRTEGGTVLIADWKSPERRATKWMERAQREEGQGPVMARNCWM